MVWEIKAERGDVSCTPSNEVRGNKRSVLGVFKATLWLRVFEEEGKKSGQNLLLFAC